MQISIRHQFLPKSASTRTSQVMDHFGVDFEQGEQVLFDDLELPISAGDIVIFTGESGSGKSSLMRRVREELEMDYQQAADVDKMTNSGRSLIDEIDLPFEEAMRLLSACGLGEAPLMLRTVDELSDGQRYRFQLAKAFSLGLPWIIADEFTATLDRALAKVIAFNLHKLAKRSGQGVLLATTHADVLEDLAPDVHVKCRLDGETRVTRWDCERKKKDCRPQMRCGSVPPPNPIGRTSLGGITAATPSDS